MTKNPINKVIEVKQNNTLYTSSLFGITMKDFQMLKI